MKRVLVTPLDWGLGHAARCVPVIRELLKRSCEVVAAGTGDSLKLLTAEFPALQHHEIPGYRPVYPRAAGMAAKMAVQLPKFFNAIRLEHRAIEGLVDILRPDLIISDNRYGAYSSRVPSVLITHQSNIMMPRRFGWLAGIVRHLNVAYINRFSRCWIPDLPGDHSLAGELTSFRGIRARIPIDHIGLLSRFTKRRTAETKYDITAVFSGPEPQRTIFEKTVLPALRTSGLRYYVVRGVFSDGRSEDGNTVNFLAGNALQDVIESSHIILARSGYSTVMDMAALGKKAIFIPTPGQTEQEYLAAVLREKMTAFSMRQDQFELRTAINESAKYTGFSNGNMMTGGHLGRALDKMLGKV